MESLLLQIPAHKLHAGNHLRCLDQSHCSARPKPQQLSLHEHPLLNPVQWGSRVQGQWAGALRVQAEHPQGVEGCKSSRRLKVLEGLRGGLQGLSARRWRSSLGVARRKCPGLPGLNAGQPGFRVLAQAGTRAQHRGGGVVASAVGSVGEGFGEPCDGPVEGAEIQRPRKDWLGFLFGLEDEERVWKVPWKGDTIFSVMVLWLLAFWLVGSWVMPLVAQGLGWTSCTSSMRVLAVYHLVTDMVELAVGLGVLHRCLARFTPLPHGWFPIKWGGMWYLEALCACVMFPLVHALAKMNMKLLPVPSFPTQLEQSIDVKDPVALVLYACVVSVCAPIWEEVIFRGFLLPSLTRYLPIWASIVVSAVIFAVAHFQPQRLLPLLFLGMIIGTVFVRSRNLLASMLLHSLWNGYVFFDLFLKCP